MTQRTLTVEPRGEREIVMTRTFDAPRHLVFEAYTRPELMKRWLGVRAGWTLATCDVELRAGGKYRYVWRHAARGDMGVGGEFREVEAPARIVATETFDDAWYPGSAVITTSFAEAAGRTTLTMEIRYESREAREVALRSGMESGVAESFDKLAEVVAS